MGLEIGTAALLIAALLAGLLLAWRRRPEPDSPLRPVLEELGRELPFLAWPSLEVTLRAGLTQLHAAWTTGDLAAAGSVLDHEYRSEQQAWLDRLARQGRKHRLELHGIERVLPLRLDSGDGEQLPKLWLQADVLRVDVVEEPGAPVDPAPAPVSLYLLMRWDGQGWRVHDVSERMPEDAAGDSHIELQALGRFNRTQPIDTLSEELGDDDWGNEVTEINELPAMGELAD